MSPLKSVNFTFDKLNRLAMIAAFVTLCGCGGGGGGSHKSAVQSRPTPKPTIATPVPTPSPDELPVTPPLALDFSTMRWPEDKAIDSIYGVDWKLEHYGYVFSSDQDLIDSTFLVITFNSYLKDRTVDLGNGEPDLYAGAITGFMDCHSVLFLYMVSSDVDVQYLSTTNVFLPSTGENFGQYERCFEENPEGYDDQFNFIVDFFNHAFAYEIHDKKLTLVGESGRKMVFSAVNLW